MDMSKVNDSLSLFEIYDFLQPEKCSEIIAICENKNEKPFESKHCIKQHRVKFYDESIHMLIQNVIDQKFNSTSDNEFSVSQIFSYVRYENGGYIAKHTDAYSEENVKYTIIIYLNDDYGNGETFVIENDTEIAISKKIGKALIFEGSKIIHGSREVIGNKNILIGKLILVK